MGKSPQYIFTFFIQTPTFSPSPSQHILIPLPLPPPSSSFHIWRRLMGVRHATDDAHTLVSQKKKENGKPRFLSNIFISQQSWGKEEVGERRKFSAVAVASVTPIVASVLLDLSMPGISGQKSMARHTTFPYSFEKEKSNKPTTPIESSSFLH